MSAQIFEEAEALLKEVENEQPKNAEELETFRIKFLGSKNILKDYFPKIKDVEGSRKKEYGQLMNSIKVAAEEKYNQTKSKSSGSSNESANELDLTLPGDAIRLGSRHPVSITKSKIIDIFKQIGFVVEEGPEIVDDWHNFSALNFPADHPARDMQDTFFIEKDPDVLLRTHTSSVQVKVMQSQKPPIRCIMPGRTYRNETISARAHVFFHQVEGLVIDEGISFADLKQTVNYLAQALFGKNTKTRLRPSYFPFTEPSAEMDVSCFICDQKGCAVCKHSGWVEIGGCGMVDPNVLDACGIDSKKYSGFAFGMGIDRIAMLKYGINDIRILFENDVRFLEQFKGVV